MNSIERQTCPAIVQATQPTDIMEKAKKGLLVAALACGVLAAIPPLRLAGVLAGRLIFVLSSLLYLGENHSKENWTGRLVNISKVALITLGLIAIAIASPLFLIASLTGDIALQTFEIGRAIQGRNQTKFLLHLSILIIDTLALSSFLLGSLELLIAATCVASFAMIVSAGYAYKKGMRFEAICYFGLAVLGSATALKVGPSIVRLKPRASSHVIGENSILTASRRSFRTCEQEAPQNCHHPSQLEREKRHSRVLSLFRRSHLPQFSNYCR
jgi:hypothetical protein